MTLSTRQQWDALIADVDRLEQEANEGVQNYRPCYLPYRPWTPLESTLQDNSPPNHSAVHLPAEIIIQILSYIPRHHTSQQTLYSCCLISRPWYAAAIPRLYHSPRITGRNFKKFVATVCPSVNAHVRKSELADLVLRLDMGNLVHDGSKSLTARLLGRVKFMLEEFVAPQASFA